MMSIIIKNWCIAVVTAVSKSGYKNNTVNGATITSTDSFDTLKAENEQLWQQLTSLQQHLKKLQNLL